MYFAKIVKIHKFWEKENYLLRYLISSDKS